MAQAQVAASAAASPKLSYLEEERKTLDSCMQRVRSGGGRGGRKVI